MGCSDRTDCRRAHRSYCFDASPEPLVHRGGHDRGFTQRNHVGAGQLPVDRSVLARLRARQLPGEPTVSLDQPRRIFADLQRSGDDRGETLNDTDEESLAADDLFSSNFGQPSIFIDPRRAMVGIRLNLGR